MKALQLHCVSNLTLRLYTNYNLVPELLTGVVALSKAAEKTSCTSRTNHSSVLLLPEVWPCSSCTLVCSLDVYLHHQVPVLIFHVLEADIAQDAGIVDEDIDPAKVLDGSLNDLVAVLDRVVVGDGLAASRCDLLDNLVGGLW